LHSPRRIDCDYLVIGGGSAGAALAARLSENSGHKIVLVEAGAEAKHHWVNIPLGVGKLLLGDRFLWQFWTSRQSAMKEQNIYWPRGKALGGSSTVNGMLWARGDAEAYDHWASQGCEGWSWQDCLPWFNKCETFEGPKNPDRGGAGPVTVSMVKATDPLTAGFIGACEARGFPFNEDFNNGHQLGVSHLQFSIRRGRRCSTHRAYLAPIKTRRNLKVLTESTAEKVIFKGTKAVGARVTQGQAKQGAETITIMARREIVLCAGALKTPQILELSGIGAPERLKKLGVEVISPNPQVGENLIDHVNMRVTYHTNKAVTVNDIMRSKARGAWEGLKYLITRKGLLSFPTVTTHALKHLKPGDRNSLIKLQLSLISGADRYANETGAGIDSHSGFNIGSFQIYPKSRGSVHAVSPDSHLNPVMSADYFEDEYDRQLAVAQMRQIRKLAQEPALREHIIGETRPGPDIDDDDALLEYVLATGQTCWHPVGSCRMGNDPNCVVDPKLRVRGTQRLRVVDASVFPHITASNTNAPTIMLAERAAHLIKSD